MPEEYLAIQLCQLASKHPAWFWSCQQIEFANDSTVLHEGRGPLLKVSDFILQCRTHSVIDVESSSNSKIRSVRGHESRGDSSVLPACRLRVFRPLSYFSLKLKTTRSLASSAEKWRNNQRHTLNSAWLHRQGLVILINRLLFYTSSSKL